MGVNISNNSVQDSSATQKKLRNLWPYGILLAIFIGIILICISEYKNHNALAMHLYPQVID